MKLNVAESNIGLLLQFFNNPLESKMDKKDDGMWSITNDRISNKFSSSQLKIIRNKIRIINNFSKYKRHKSENGKNKLKKT